MNEFNAFAKAAHGGFVAYLRTAKDAGAKPVLGKGGKPEIFSSELDAVKAAMHHLLRYINGHLVRDGEIVSAVAAADSHFSPALRQAARRRSRGGGADGRPAF